MPTDTKERSFFRFGRNTTVAGFVSFFMDVSSEMIYPLVPLFLANVLGVNKSMIGLIEGIAESTASILKVFSGWISDRIGNRKWLMAAGYGISVFSRPIVAMASGWQHVLAFRFVDRFGKGIRTAPRDAIIAESTPKEYFGRAFGFHRAMDSFGAVIGPLIAFILLALFQGDYRLVFWLSIIPGIMAVLLIVLFISEKTVIRKVITERPRLSIKSFDWRFKVFVVIATIFAVGNSSDVFLILRAQQVGIPVMIIPIVYLMFNLVYALSSIPAGMAADRFGKKRMILLGFVLFALIYFGFAVARTGVEIWLLFGLYGLFMGITEGVQKAFVASIIPEDFKATAFGIFNMATGLAMLPASIVGGLLWDHVSPAATFYFGAVTAVIAAILFVVIMLIGGRQAGESGAGSNGARKKQI